MSRQTLRLLTFLALVAVLALAVAWGSGPLSHDDLFFHLATGRYVVEHHSVPTTDSFSFTRQGERWVSHEWGFGWLSYVVYLWRSYDGLIQAKAVVAVSISALMFLLMRRRAGGDLAQTGPLCVALLALGLWAFHDEIIWRASLVSTLLIVFLVILIDWFDRTGNRVAMLAIAVLFLFWGNFHGEVIFGLLVLGLVTAESLLARWWSRDDAPWSGLLRASARRPYLLLFLVCLALTLINPNGIQVLLYPFKVSLFLFAGEVPLEMGHFGSPTPLTSPAFFLLLAALLLALLPLTKLKQLSLTEILLVGGFLVLALRSHRFIFWFVIFALPVIARLLATNRRRSTAVRLSIVLVTAAFCSITAARAWQQSPEEEISAHFPQGASRLLLAEDLDGRPFNHQNYGGFLHWTLQIPVFWDGRNVLFGPLMKEVQHIPLADVVEEWGIDYLLLTPHELDQIRPQMSDDEWGMVFWDDFSVLFLKRQPAHADALEKYELLGLPPFGGVEGLNLLAQDPERAAEIRAELNQVLEFEPRCLRALYLGGLLRSYQGNFDAAEDELRQAIAIRPNAFVYRALADVVEQKGRADEANRLRIQAIDLDPKEGAE